jgi:hypothetical protein
MILVTFAIALGAVLIFSVFAWLATAYRRKAWSRFLMWAGILFFLCGCYFFGVNLIRLPLGWMIAAIAFFTLSFAISAGYFLSKGRRAV